MESTITEETSLPTVPEGYELVETAKFEKLVDLNKEACKQNAELKKDLITVISSFARLQGALGLKDGKFSISMLTKLSNPKTMDKLKQELGPMMEVVGKYVAVEAQ